MAVRVGPGGVLVTAPNIVEVVFDDDVPARRASALEPNEVHLLRRLLSLPTVRDIRSNIAMRSDRAEGVMLLLSSERPLHAPD